MKCLITLSLFVTVSQSCVSIPELPPIPSCPSQPEAPENVIRACTPAVAPVLQACVYTCPISAQVLISTCALDSWDVVPTTDNIPCKACKEDTAPAAPSLAVRQCLPPGDGASRCEYACATPTDPPRTNSSVCDVKTGLWSPTSVSLSCTAIPCISAAPSMTGGTCSPSSVSLP